MMRKIVIGLGAFALILSGVFLSAVPAQAASPGNLIAPFDTGQSTCIYQGYSSGTHTGTSQYGLDLVAGNCNSTSAAGLNVRAPLAGTVAYWQAAYGNLCINVGGGKSISLTHINASVTSGAITAGQHVGTVANAGAVNNNGVAHLHYEAWSSSNCYNSSVIPFDAAHGTRICGAPDLIASPSGTFSNGKWSGTTFTSDTCGTGSPSGLADGTYIMATDTSRVYVVAGGSPLYVSSWSAVGGQHAINATYTQAQIDAMPAYPADGTAVVDTTGTVYIIAGGGPLAVSSFSNIPPVSSLTHIDTWAVQNQLRQYPVDGTTVVDTTGTVFVISGGSALTVTSFSNIPAVTSLAHVDAWAIHNQLLQYPKDGTTFVDYATGTVYVVAGGGPLAVNSFANIPPVTGLASVDHWVLANQLRQYPLNGTMIRDQNGGIWVVAGGAPMGVSSLSNVPYTSWVNMDAWALTNQLRATPTDGTIVKGYVSGNTYVVNGGIATSTSPSSSAVVIDDWAISHQLGG